MSLDSVKMLADHHWCAAAATLDDPTAIHMLLAAGANIVGTIANAAMSMTVLRAAFTDQPRLMK